MYPDCHLVTRTVEVGGRTNSELLEEFARLSVSINEQGLRLLDDERFSVSSTPYRLVTVELAVRDLGFSEGVTSAPLFAKAQDLGLGLCPLEAGPYLRLDFLDQREGPWITIASARPPEASAAPSGFYLRRREDGLWLRGYTASSCHVWDADERFIFAHAKPGDIIGHSSV